MKYLKEHDEFNWEFDEEEFDDKNLQAGFYFWNVNKNHHINYNGTDKIITQIVNFYNKYKYKCKYFRAHIEKLEVELGYVTDNLYLNSNSYKEYKYMGSFEEWIKNY